MSTIQQLKRLIKVPAESFAANFGPHQRRNGLPRLWVMMYHRVLPPEHPEYAHEEPGMIVEPVTLEMQLSWLKQQFTLVSLSDWLKRLKKGLSLPEKACVITFDDGWIDNYYYALPILRRLQVPATLFAVADMIGTNNTFWPNRLQRLLRFPMEQRQECKFIWSLNSNELLNPEKMAWIIDDLKQYSDDFLLEKIEEAEHLMGVSEPSQPSLMNWEQLIEFANTEGCEVGSHTCTHFRLRNGIEKSTLEREVISSKLKLQQRLEKQIETFCFPNGDFCSESLAMVASHYEGAVTTVRGVNNASIENCYRLTRIPIHQHISDTPRRFKARLSGWL